MRVTRLKGDLGSTLPLQAARPWLKLIAIRRTGRIFFRGAEQLRVSCLVFGQGFCSEDRPYFGDFLKRVEIAEWLELQADVVARFPETEVSYPATVDFLAEEMELASKYDVIIALQPRNTTQGAPTLRSELQDLAADPRLRERVFLFRPAGERFLTFDSIAARLVPSQVLEYREDRYVACHDIRDMAEHVLDLVELGKRTGIWPELTR